MGIGFGSRGGLKLEVPVKKKAPEGKPAESTQVESPKTAPAPAPASPSVVPPAQGT